MAKRSKPTVQSLRQGQTIYYVERYYHWCPRNRPAPEIKAQFLYNEKTPLPPLGCIIDRMPVSRIREWIRQNGANIFFYSRKKAARSL
jgi:hypothetical protein